MFGRKRQLRKKAEKLVQVSRICVISLLVPLMDKKPLIKTLIKDNGEYWDFLMTLATVGICVQNIPESVVASRYIDEFIDEIDKALEAWDRQAPSALANLSVYLNNFSTSEMPRHWGFGCWVVHNLKGSEPNHAEMDLGAALGELLENQYKPQIIGAI